MKPHKFSCDIKAHVNDMRLRSLLLSVVILSRFTSGKFRPMDDFATHRRCSLVGVIKGWDIAIAFHKEEGGRTIEYVT